METYLEVAAGKTDVEIIPKEPVPRLRTAGTVVGPFLAHIKTTCPLSLAVELKRISLCDILVPEWLTVDNLSLLRDQERQSGEIDEGLPHHYFHIWKALNDVGALGPNKGEIMELVNCLKLIRVRKVRERLLRPDGMSTYGMCAVEMHLVRGVLARYTAIKGKYARLGEWARGGDDSGDDEIRLSGLGQGARQIREMR